MRPSALVRLLTITISRHNPAPSPKPRSLGSDMLPIRQSPKVMAAGLHAASSTSPPPSSALTSAGSNRVSPVPAAPPTKQCWECQRRGIVCDSTEPVCTKCRSAGLVCPGFDDKRPLTWLAPGKVTARPRKKKRAPNGSRALAAAAKRGVRLVEKLTGEKHPPFELDSLHVAEVRLEGVNGLRRATVLQGGSYKDVYDSTFILFPELCLDKDIEQVFQAARYYDLQIYPEYSPILDMIPQAFVRKFDLPTIPYFPTSIRHSLICVTLGHRINQLPSTSDPSFVTDSWHVFYRHRGKAIAALAADIGSVDPVRRYIALISTVMFLMVDIQQCYPDWRVHYNGLRHLIDACGGLDFVVSLNIESDAMIHIYILCGIMSNAVTHRDQQITCITLAEQRKFVQNTYDEKLMPFFMCPRPMLLILITINELRARGSARVFTYLPNNDRDEVSDETLTSAVSSVPDDLMAEIEAFETAAWADSITRGHQPQVVVLAELWKTTLLLYCIVSLQATGLMPRSFELEVIKTLHGDKLFGLLREHNRQNLLMQKSSLFSVAVAGFLAAERSEEDRIFVRDECEFLSRASGQASSLMLLVVMQGFWGSAKTEWDECFEKGYALSMA
ncbi:transcriptional activator protein UGA3 [Microdochium nivale]|nr:transcriptional activator protein UGA3 [Microdochium nivale]